MLNPKFPFALIAVIIRTMRINYERASVDYITSACVVSVTIVILFNGPINPAEEAENIIDIFCVCPRMPNLWPSQHRKFNEPAA